MTDVYNIKNGDDKIEKQKAKCSIKFGFIFHF